MATKKKAAAKPTKAAAAETPSGLVDEQLARYRAMRDFQVTAEPAGNAKRPIPHEVVAARDKGARPARTVFKLYVE